MDLWLRSMVPQDGVRQQCGGPLRTSFCFLARQITTKKSSPLTIVVRLGDEYLLIACTQIFRLLVEGG